MCPSSGLLAPQIQIGLVFSGIFEPRFLLSIVEFAYRAIAIIVGGLQMWTSAKLANLRHKTTSSYLPLSSPFSFDHLTSQRWSAECPFLRLHQKRIVPQSMVASHCTNCSFIVTLSLYVLFSLMRFCDTSHNVHMYRYNLQSIQAAHHIFYNS